MATITDRPSSSSSPISSTRPNPSARNSEIKDPMRRSFTGNPFSKPPPIVPNSRGGFNPNTPANSPSGQFFFSFLFLFVLFLVCFCDNHMFGCQENEMKVNGNECSVSGFLRKLN